MHLDYAHFSGKGNFYGRHATAKRRETPFSRTSRSKTHIHIVFPRGWPSCFFCFFLYRGGGAEGREHETGFLCFPPFPLFISWVLLSLPGHTGYVRVFLALQRERHTSLLFLLPLRRTIRNLADPRTEANERSEEPGRYLSFSSPLSSRRSYLC